MGEKSTSIIKRKHKLNDKNQIKKLKRESMKTKNEVVINKDPNYKNY